MKPAGSFITIFAGIVLALYLLYSAQMKQYDASIQDSDYTIIGLKTQRGESYRKKLDNLKTMEPVTIQEVQSQRDMTVMSGSTLISSSASLVLLFQLV
jgi:hypothetical protein